MATYFARKAGNINATDVWATTPSGTASNLFPTFTNADVLMSNSFAITVNVSTTVAEIRNDTTGGATNGGSFSLSAGVILTADLYNAAGVAAIITCAISAPSSASIVSNVIRNASSSGNSFAVSNTGSGTLNISVSNNITGGAGGSGVSRAAGVNAAGGIVNITGNVTGGTHASAPGAQANGGTLNITGIVTGNVGPGAANMLTGTTTIIGQARGGASAVGAINESTGMLVATRAVGNGYGPGNVAGLAATVGISNAGLGVVEIQELEYGTFGQSPTSGTGIRLKKASSNVAVFNYCDTAGAKTLIDATQNAAMPAASDVRSGVSYASGAITGTCAVPAAGSVSLGVPVDAGFGTAVLTTANVQSALTAQGLTTARAGNLDNLDTTVSSRLAPNGTLATVTTLTNAPTVPSASAIATAVWAAADKTGYSLTSAERTAIATAVEASILNEADGQQILNAIVGAIGNTNLSEVSLVAAIRSDIERTGGKLDSVPTAAANASAVWGTGTKTITGGVVDTLTNSPSVPSAASIAAATRTELAVELARVDSAVSSRMAASEASKLDAVKAKTDALNTERLANVATTAIVGNLIAQANS